MPECSGCGGGLARDPSAPADPSAWYCPMCRTRTVVHAPPDPPPVPPAFVRATTFPLIAGGTLEEPTPLRPGSEPPPSEPEGRRRGRRSGGGGSEEGDAA